MVDHGQQQLVVTPTPPPERRLSDQLPWDEAERPTGPVTDPDRSYSPFERATSQHLVDVHDMLRRELDEIRGLVDDVVDARVDTGAARSRLNEMTLRQNSWTLGTYCAAYCRIVTGHHELEDVSVFPHLRRTDERLAPVLDRLRHEHDVIHQLIERVDGALVALLSDEDARPRLRASVDLFTDALLSHLSYEERELVGPLARTGFG
jgi:hemerythrin-like domain-containing protein